MNFNSGKLKKQLMYKQVVKESKVHKNTSSDRDWEVWKKRLKL